MRVIFTGTPYSKAEECYCDFNGLTELIAAGYIILDVMGVNG